MDKTKTNWSKVFRFILVRTYFTTVGVAIGISICKFCPKVWNGGEPRIALIMAIVGVACIVAGLIVREEE